MTNKIDQRVDKIWDLVLDCDDNMAEKKVKDILTQTRQEDFEEALELVGEDKEIKTESDRWLGKGKKEMIEELQGIGEKIGYNQRGDEIRRRLNDKLNEK